ncbi:hypothetical protein [Longimicrobium sp.]|uniref:hypothetical protein n=1 Tax=Longimicrobium sp. TaxID=2029185 RepID=UPI003B3B8DF7
MTFPLRRLMLAALPLALAFALPRSAAAQTGTVAVAADSLYVITLTDGSVLHGQVEDAGATVIVRTQAGVTVRLERQQIRSIERARPGAVANGLPKDPNHTRLFFGPTARAVGGGRGYLGVYEVFFPFLTYGVTSKFSVSGGTPILPGAVGELWYFAPKLTLLETETLAVATGVLALAVENETAGIVYGAGTFGGSDQAVTAGIGWGFSDGDLHNQAVVMVGGELRAGRNTKLITENYLIPGFDGSDGSILSGGIRFFGEQLSADLGIAVSPTDCESDFCWIPLVNFVYSF